MSTAIGVRCRMYNMVMSMSTIVLEFRYFSMCLPWWLGFNTHTRFYIHIHSTYMWVLRLWFHWTPFCHCHWCCSIWVHGDFNVVSIPKLLHSICSVLCAFLCDREIFVCMKERERQREFFHCANNLLMAFDCTIWIESIF